jgi:hypothetical protein
MVLMMVYVTRNYWILGLCSSSGIQFNSVLEYRTMDKV